MVAPAFAVAGAGEQTVDQERAHLFGGWRDAGEIDRDPA